MSDNHPVKSIDPDNLDSLSGSYKELSKFTGEKPDAWIEDDSRGVEMLGNGSDSDIGRVLQDRYSD